jgi:hypothetical protein
MSLVEQTTRFFSTPGSFGTDLYKDAITRNECSIAGRFLFLVQIIASVVALPFILLATIIQAFKEGEYCEALEDMACGLCKHILYGLPMSILSLFSPEKFAVETTEAYDRLLAKIIH